jgi:hypothetical protein
LLDHRLPLNDDVPVICSFNLPSSVPVDRNPKKHHPYLPRKNEIIIIIIIIIIRIIPNENSGKKKKREISFKC